jgi:hypothetical protein
LFSLKVQYLGQLAHSIAFVKREAHSTLDLKCASNDNSHHLSTQLQVLNLGYVGEDSNIFELAVNYVEYSLIPLFSTYKSASSQSAADKSKAAGGTQMQGLDNVKKDLVQLKVHLNQCL